MNPGEASDPRPAPPPASPLKVIFLILAVALGLYVVYEVRLILLVLVFAVFFGYLILPLVARIEQLVRAAGVPRTMSRGVALGAVYLGLWVALAGGVILLTPKLTQQVTEMASAAPDYAQALRAWGGEWSAYERAKLPEEFRDRLDAWIGTASEAAVAEAQGAAIAAIGIVTYVPWLVLIPVLAFFLVKDVEQIRYYMVYALPPRLRGPGYQLVQELNTAISAYVRAQLLACLLIGVISCAGFALLRLPYAVLLGVFAGVLEFIPLVGPLVVAVVACTVAAVQAPSLALWVAIFLIVLRVAEDYVIYPRLMGHGTHLHPLTIILAVLVGAELGGVVGIFLAVPGAAMASVGYRHYAHWARAEAKAHPADSTDSNRTVAAHR